MTDRQSKMEPRKIKEAYRAICKSQGNHWKGSWKETYSEAQDEAEAHCNSHPEYALHETKIIERVEWEHG